VLRLVTVLLALAPVAALVPAAILDRGPHGAFRGTLFPLALTLLDDWTWECVRPSVGAACAAAIVSLAIGVGLGRIVARSRFWGRRLLLALACVPLAVPPLFGALGLRHLFWEVISPVGSPLAGDLGAWMALIGLATLQGAPLVMLGVSAASSRIDPTWEDGARASGAGSWRVEWTLTWPLVRLAALRASALVFATTLLEPGAPLVLGLRRSLAYQVADAAMNDAAPTRAAILVGLGCAIAWTVRLALVFRGRGGVITTARQDHPARTRRAPWVRAAAYCGLLTAWSGLAALPVLGLSAQLVLGLQVTSGAQVKTAFGALLNTSEMHAVVLHSLALGAATATIAMLVSCGVARRTDAPGSLAGRLEAIPAPATAVGLLALTWLLSAVGLRLASHTLDPYRTYGLALVWALVVVRLPWMLRVAHLALGQCRPEMIEAAVTLGAAPRRARWTILGALAGPLLIRAWFVTAVLAASSVGPALILAPTSASQTLGPAVLFLADTPDEATRAAALALAAIAANALALGWSSRARGEPVACRPDG
jgi:iron(III) transport system permease protein